MTATPLLLSVDVEPDPRSWPIGGRPPLEGTDRMAEALDRVRDDVDRSAGRGLIVTWYVRTDRQVALGYGAAEWLAVSHAALFDRARRAGDALGLHAHLARLRPDGTFAVDIEDPAWVEDCLGEAHEVFDRTFGRAATYQRLGEGLLSPATLSVSTRLGVRVDLTMEPGHLAAPPRSNGPDLTAHRVDSRSAPRRPYRPSWSDPQRPAAGEPSPDIWEIPVTTVPEHRARRTTGALLGAASHLVRGRWRRRLQAARHFALDQRPLFLSRPPGEFQVGLAAAIDGQPLVQVTVRSGVAAQPRARANIADNLHHLVALGRQGRVSFCDPGDAIERFSRSG